MEIANISQSVAESVSIAMATDAWGAIRSRCASIFSRSETNEQSPIELIDQYNETISATPDPARPAIRATVMNEILLPMFREILENNPDSKKTAQEIIDLMTQQREQSRQNSPNIFENVKPGRDFNYSERDNIIVNRGNEG